MIDQQELENRFHSPEGELIERKRNANDLDAIRETISAFANDLANRRQPGVIFIGIENNGTCANLIITDRLLTMLAGLRADGKLTPFPVIRVDQTTIDGCTIAFVAVAPTDNPPIKLNNVAYVRVGPTTRRATPPEEQALVEKRRWGNLPFDAHPVPGATIADLDVPRIELEYLPALVSPDVLAANTRTLEEKLLALRLLRPDGSPTSTAVLIAGTTPDQYFPGAYVQALRVAGTELTADVIDNRAFSGSLPDQLRQLDDYLRVNVQRRLAVGELTHQEQPNYPIEALRQLIASCDVQYPGSPFLAGARPTARAALQFGKDAMCLSVIIGGQGLRLRSTQHSAKETSAANAAILPT
jgi:ATP-dependent DNA helicase RecG